ncbi:CYTH domain-containing protein [Actinomadura logoneensis]|uniref:CYTH domain-containing protein n=1 Tax=Actinomadura logoneensis TaxID=2293572 RepID=A0A372JV07_9ACTN|nr:CYTH domain-containing protein [Actinomadura logoneensis]RFU43574.1 CYTH domain-containing protein [Actinomadura logoneensis]
MPAEYEVKVLDIDPTSVANLICSKGGRQVSASRLQRRYVYDIIPGDESKWIRLRDNGTKATLAVKEISHDGIDGTYEVEVGIDDLEATNELLGFLGFQPKAYQENRRTSFVLDGAQLEIDEWPMIPPYLEIEAGTPEEVRRVATLLGFEGSQLTSENTTKVYKRYGIELGEHKIVSFSHDGAS